VSVHMLDDVQPRRRLGLASAIVGCLAVILFIVWLRTSHYWPMPITVLDSSMAVDGEHREYRLVTPDAVQGLDLIPVVFALHGALDSTSQMANTRTWTTLPSRMAFAGVSSRASSQLAALHSTGQPSCVVPDLRFFEAMREEMVSKHHADPRRVYVVGVSQGGAMANVLTAKCSRLIAATVCCCGWLPEPLGPRAFEHAMQMSHAVHCRLTGPSGFSGGCSVGT